LRATPAPTSRKLAPVLLGPFNPRPDFGPEEADSVASVWGLYLFVGVVSIIFGAIILSVDWSVDSLAAFVGVLFLIQGAAFVVTKPLDGGDRSTNVVAGLLAAGAGLALLVWPDKGLYTLGVFVGIFVISSGVLHVVGAFANRHVPHWWLSLALGLIELPIGIWAIRRPGLTIAVVVTLTGVWAIVTGVWQCVVAFEVRNLARRFRPRPA
jgi:uncharacterized membrane protein HdeD (DUF308 family)